MNSGCEGSSSVTVFILLLFISSITVGVLNIITGVMHEVAKIETIYSREERLQESLELLIEQHSYDPTPDSCSFFDPIWLWIDKQNKESGGIRLELEELSSRFNLNFVRTKMIDHSFLRVRLKSGKNLDELKQYRGEEGFYENLEEGYGDFFTDIDLAIYFTAYSYANFNITYEDSLVKIYKERIPQGGSLSFHQRVQTLLAGKRLINKEEFRELFPNDFEKLKPVINTEPQMNINYIHKDILHSILLYPYGGQKLEGGELLYEKLLDERSVGEITAARLKTLLPSEGDSLRICSYLGTKSWFWRGRATLGNITVSVIFSLLPLEGRRKYRIIKWVIDS